jgi:hypothetical protein
MDGDVPDPVFHTCHKLVDRQRQKDYEERLERKAHRMAKRIAAKLKIYPGRIKTNFSSQEVMKYAKRLVHADVGGECNSKAVNTGAEEEANREAVRVMFRTPKGEDRVRCAAECGGTILHDLTDKALLLFNCYYVRPKSRENGCTAAETAIKEAFAEFIDKEFYQ